MSKHSYSLPVIADILLIVGAERARAEKTRMMYHANLSYKLLCTCLNEFWVLI